MSDAHREQLDAAVAGVWQRMRGTVLARFTGLETALAAVMRGELSDDMRELAIHEAHKLAGSLGMFGFPHGTELARELETAFRKGLAADAAARYSERLAELKRALEA